MAKLLCILLALAPVFPKGVESDESRIFGKVFELLGDSAGETKDSALCLAVFYRTFQLFPKVGAQLNITRYVFG